MFLRHICQKRRDKSITALKRFFETNRRKKMLDDVRHHLRRGNVSEILISRKKRCLLSSRRNYHDFIFESRRYICCTKNGAVHWGESQQKSRPGNLKNPIKRTLKDIEVSTNTQISSRDSDDKLKTNVGNRRYHSNRSFLNTKSSSFSDDRVEDIVHTEWHRRHDENQRVLKR